MRFGILKKLFIFAAILMATLLTFCPSVNAQEVFKITSANFDTSNSFILLSAQDNSEEPIAQEIKIVAMDNPKRIYFDLESSILTIPKQDWTFHYGAIRQVKIAQFSTNPNQVRVVIYVNDNFDAEDISFVRFKNNLFIKFKNNALQNEYFQNTYRDEHESASDFYEYTTVMTPDENGLLEQIQNVAQNLVKKDLKLNTKYYLNKVTIKQNAVLLNGFGATTIERPMILANPSRVVFDIPNAVVDQSLRNKEFQINQTDRVKIGQFSVNKARVVIATEHTENYIPMFSSDNQSIIIGNYKEMNTRALAERTTDVLAYGIDIEDAQTASLILSFNNAVIHGVERTANQFSVYMFNALKYNEAAFLENIKNTLFAKAKIELLPNVGLKLVIPIENSGVLSSYLSADGKNLKIKLKEVKPTSPIRKPITVKPAKPTDKKPSDPSAILLNNKKTIVLDAGHGGSDVGAMSGQLYEKDIVLEVTKMVETLLTKEGFNVYLTRNNDTYVSLEERCEISAAYEPDIFVSVHVNSSLNPDASGVETHYYHQESLELAQQIQASLASSINSPNRGLFKSKFYVINHTTSPAVLVEIGFISNETEREQLDSKSRKDATAQAIVDGIIEYFKTHK